MPEFTERERKPQNRLVSILAYVVILAFLLPGCAGKGGDNPAVPAVDEGTGATDTPELTAATEQAGTASGKALWGMWDVTFDGDSGFQVVPLRGVEYSLNVNIFLQPPSGSLSNIQIDMINMEKLFIAGDVVVDVSLSHPFPALTQFTGFDVLGVVIGTGNYIANSDIGIAFGNPDLDPVLMNADGYTRWMNQMEFTTQGLLGYTEGALGNKNGFWSATLNGYKYFATGLSTTERIVTNFQSSQAISERGMFATNSTCTRRYSLHFPMVGGYPNVSFQYAVVASWMEPANDPPVSIPGDFPPAANMQEAFHCEISTVGSTLYWNDMHDNGGDLFLTLEIFDWQGLSNPDGVAGEIKMIMLDSPSTFINGGSKMVFTSDNWTELAGTCDNSVRLALDAGSVNLQGPCPFDNDALVTIVTAEEGNYDNGLGAAFPQFATLSSYARLFYDLGNVCNDPPVVWFTNCPTKTISVANRTFRWDAEDDVTPNSDLYFRYKFDTDPWTDWEEDVRQAYFENMTESTHTVWVQARDNDGQVAEAECTFTIQLPAEPQPPEVGFTNCTEFVRTSTYTWHLDLADDNTAISHLKVRYNYNSGGWVQLPDGSTSITLNGLVSGGPFQLLVEVEDLDGMIDQALCEFSVNFNPDVVITDCPPQDLNINAFTINWTGSDPELDPLEYSTRLDTEVWSAWSTALFRNLAGLSSGNHTFYVRVRDIGGGEDQTQCNFAVNFGPSISITNKPPGLDINSTSYTFNWTSSDDLDSPLTMDFNVELDGVWQGWQTGISSYNWNPLPSGNRSFRIRVRDTGNPALWAEDSCNFTVNFKPTVSIDNCPAGLWANSTITFNWTGIDDNTPEAGMEYSFKMDSEAWSAWQLGTLIATYNGLTDDTHTFSVRVRDMGNPQLSCETVPSTCDSCTFTIDTSCAVPPSDVQNFAATDNDPMLNAREVNLTWTTVVGCVDFYDIERREYDYATGWSWQPLITLPHPTASYLDTDARYSGPYSAIEYRIRARNVSGNSPAWSVDTGYPITRKIHLAMWCTADDASGTDPSTTWARAAADFNDTNEFWIDYGVEFVLKNAGNFFWIPVPAYKDLSGGEDGMMHSTYGQVVFPDAINIYYVTSSNGNTSRGYCMCYCPGSNHNTLNVFIVLCRDTRGNAPFENEIVLAHELGHGTSRYWDIYLLDTNHNIIHDEPTTCASEDTWCTVPPWTPPLFCDDNAAYPENPGASGKIPKQLMWYSFIAPVEDYTITVNQYIYTDEWIHGYEGNYPWP